MWYAEMGWTVDFEIMLIEFSQGKMEGHVVLSSIG